MANNYGLDRRDPIKSIDKLAAEGVETERDTIIESLSRNNGHRKATAQELQISERTLYRKIKQYNLDK